MMTQKSLINVLLPIAVPALLLVALLGIVFISPELSLSAPAQPPRTALEAFALVCGGGG